MKNPQSKVDKHLSKLTEEDLAEWNQLCRFNPNYSELQKFLEEKGGKGINIQNLSNWWISNKPRGKEAIIINSLSEKYRGTDPTGLLEMSAGICASLIEELQSLLADELAMTSPSSKLTNLVELIKELRQSSSELHNVKSTKHTNQLIMAGALEMADLLTKIFKETPFAEALDSGIKAALEQMQ